MLFPFIFSSYKIRRFYNCYYEHYNKEETIMFKKGFKFYMGMLTAGLAISGGFIALMRYSTVVREWLATTYVKLTKTIVDRFTESCEEEE